MKTTRTSLFSRLLHWIRVAVVIFVVASVAIVLLYRFIPPPFTPLMVWRLAEQKLDGKPLHLEKSWKPYHKISPYLTAAVVISEDQEFFDHHGFDFDAIQSAMKHNENHKHTVGASTISQQTAKNVFLWPDRSWLRKGLEVYFTILIELIWSKQRILEVYLNEIETGDGIYGVEAASQHYFHRSSSALSEEQAALIAATLPNPRKWAPPHSPSHVFRRQGWILRQMPEFVGQKEFASTSSATGLNLRTVSFNNNP